MPRQWRLADASSVCGLPQDGPSGGGSIRQLLGRPAAAAAHASVPPPPTRAAGAPDAHAADDGDEGAGGWVQSQEPHGPGEDDLGERDRHAPLASSPLPGAAGGAAAAASLSPAVGRAAGEGGGLSPEAARAAAERSAAWRRDYGSASAVGLRRTAHRLLLLGMT